MVGGWTTWDALSLFQGAELFQFLTMHHSTSGECFKVSERQHYPPGSQSSFPWQCFRVQFHLQVSLEQHRSFLPFPSPSHMLLHLQWCWLNCFCAKLILWNLLGYINPPPPTPPIFFLFELWSVPYSDESVIDGVINYGACGERKG